MKSNKPFLSFFQHSCSLTFNVYITSLVIFFLVTVMAGYSCTIEPSRGDLDLNSEWTASTKNLKHVSYTMKTSKEDDKIFGLKDYESWKTLLDAAKVRNYAPITDVAKDFGEEEASSITENAGASSQ